MRSSMTEQQHIRSTRTPLNLFPTDYLIPLTIIMSKPLIAPLPLMIMRLYIRINVVPLNAVMRSKLLSGLLLPAGTVVARTDALTERLQ